MAYISGLLLSTIITNFAQAPDHLKQVQMLIADKTGSWDIPHSDEPEFYKFVRRGIEKAITGIKFRSKYSKERNQS